MLYSKSCPLADAIFRQGISILSVIIIVNNYTTCVCVQDKPTLNVKK